MPYLLDIVYAQALQPERMLQPHTSDYSDVFDIFTSRDQKLEAAREKRRERR